MTTAETVTPQDVILIDAGANEPAVAEVVRAMIGLPADEAAALVARPPCPLRTRIAPALAEALRVKLVAAGAAVTVSPHGQQPGPRFDLFLIDRGASKIDVVRAIRMVTNLELREAVELVDDAPSAVRRKLDPEEAAAVRHVLREAGAVVELRPYDPTFVPPAPPVRPAIPVSDAVPAPAASASPAGFSVVLRAHGPNKIAVIKEVRAITGLGLREALNLVEAPGSVVKAGLERDEARRYVHQLAEVGAVVELLASDGDDDDAHDEEAADDDDALFDVVLTSFGNNKISVIKEVREVTALGLKDAKDLVESAPANVLTGVSRDRAMTLVRKLLAVGAKVELRRSGSSEPASEPEAARDRLNLILKHSGENRIQVIKLVREITGLGLKESLDLVDSAPKLIKAELDRDEAIRLGARLVEVGATVDLR